MADASRYFVFVALTGDRQIQAWSMDPATGALELRTVSDAHGPIGSLHLHRSTHMVYGAHVQSTELSSYRLDTATGALDHVNSVDTGLATPALAVTDGAGRHLIASYYTGGGVTVHRIAGDGSIGEQVEYVDTGPKAHAVLIDDDRFVFIPHVCPNNKTSQFRYDAATGRLTPNDPSEVVPAGEYTGPRHMCFGPGRRDRLHRQRAGQHGHRAPLRRREAGTLEPVQEVSTLPEGYAEVSHTAHVEVHPNEPLGLTPPTAVPGTASPASRSPPTAA